ncbi:globin [Microbulbifer sp. Q7]|uniref:globin n=1 Tax=Microbulbifer sp. Q7 TaxID=1785091 RepID=UPI00082CF706|nr:globin [Microbulbifer sp. Q7]
MGNADSDIVFQSYGRCCNNERFFIDFYDRFMSSSEVIRSLFTHTDMPAQRHLLRNGILQLVLHARGMPDTKLRALGCSHSRKGHNIRPEWYGLWLDALLATLRQYDPQFDEATELAWRRAIGPGIELIRAAY